MALRVLITGATGFTGLPVCQAFLESGHQVIAGVRTTAAGEILSRRLGGSTGIAVTGDLASDAAFTFPDTGTFDVLVHLAGRAHHVGETGRAPELFARYRRANVEATARAIRVARGVGCRRAVYVSTAKVHGDVSSRPFSEEDELNPHGPSACSKAEAEIAARKAAADGGMELVVVRPPLIYGPDAKANLLTLLRLVRAGIPIPVSSRPNTRSMISVTNFASFLVRCAEDPRAANEDFLVSDCHDLSTRELAVHLARAMGREPHILPIPVLPLGAICRAIGKVDSFDRIFGSFTVDSRKATEFLQWRPLEDPVDGLRRMAHRFLEECALQKTPIPPIKVPCRY